MKESVTYQAILDEGRVEGRLQGEQRALLITGQRRLGIPSPSIQDAVSKITSQEHLETLMQRIFDVETWEELLQEDAPE